MEKLFSEFDPARAADWKQQVLKDLKGVPFEQLTWHNPNGFDVDPFYTNEDLGSMTDPLSTHPGWEICETIEVADERSANQKALKALNSGASSLHFVLSGKVDFNVLLNEISIKHIEFCFILRYADPGFRIRLHSYLDAENINAEELRGGICYDGIANLVVAGNWLSTPEKDFAEANTWVDATIYQNSGATQSFELACALAHAHEYLVHLRQRKQFRFSVSIGSDFFGEIAKLRALRKLWALIANEYGNEPGILIHAVSSELNQSALDAYNNMLRSTTEGMSAVIGGCNSLTLEAYNKTFDKTSDFSERIARNQQLIFKEESYLDKVADMGAGSYYIEHLTDELASKALEELQIIERKGGFLSCLRSNYIQERIAQQAHHLVGQFREQQIVLVGVNKFQNKAEPAKVSVRNEIKPNGIIETIKPLFLSDHLVKENA